MIVVDANLLVYAYVESMAQHEAARVWLDQRVQRHNRVGLPWPSAPAFVRLVSKPRVFERPSSVTQAWTQVQDWLDCAPAWIPGPTDRHRQVLDTLLTGTNLRANHVPDAHLAALAIEHGLTMCSTDGDFARFPDLSWENPIR